MLVARRSSHRVNREAPRCRFGAGEQSQLGLRQTSEAIHEEQR